MATDLWNNLEGRVVLVTGASSGIGRDLCLNLAAAGCLVVAAARRIERLRSLCDEINASSPPPSDMEISAVRSVAVELDVSAKGSEIEKAVKKAWAAFGRIDVLVNNAGVRGGVYSPIDWPEEEWQANISTKIHPLFSFLQITHQIGGNKNPTLTLDEFTGDDMKDDDDEEDGGSSNRCLRWVGRYWKLSGLPRASQKVRSTNKTNRLRPNPEKNEPAFLLHFDEYFRVTGPNAERFGQYVGQVSRQFMDYSLYKNWGPDHERPFDKFFLQAQKDYEFLPYCPPNLPAIHQGVKIKMQERVRGNRNQVKACYELWLKAPQDHLFSRERCSQGTRKNGGTTSASFFFF